MSRNEKLLVYWCLLISLCAALVVSSSVYGYVGSSNITAAVVNDTRVDPSVPLEFTIGPIVNSTGGYVAGGNASLILDGVGDRIDVLNAAQLNPLTGITVSCIITPAESGAAGQFIVFKGTGTAGWNTQQYRLIIDGGPVAFQIVDSTDTPHLGGPSTTSLVANTRYVLHGTWNGTHKLVYINGVLEGNSGAVFANLKTTAGNLTLGNAAAEAHYFNGTLDDVMIYSRALSQQEITEQVTYGLYSNNTDLDFHIDFDEDVDDRSGNGNNGIVVGTPVATDGWAFVPVYTSINGQGSLVNSTTGLMTLIQNAPANINNHTVNIYALTNGVQNATALVQVDGYTGTLSLPQQRVSVGQPLTIVLTAESLLDNHVAVAGSTATVNGINLSFNGGTIRGSDRQYIITTKTYDNITAFFEGTYGITNITLTNSVTGIWSITPTINEGMIVSIGLIPFLILVLALSDAKRGELGVNTVYKVIIVTAILGAMAAYFATQGY